MTAYEAAFEHIMSVERGFSNRASDRGGATKFGITQRTLAAYREHPVTVEDVMELEEDEAADVYWKLYWTPNHLDDILDAQVALIIFDQVVNRGGPFAVKIAQKVVGLKTDGIIGPKTLEAINAVPAKTFCLAFIKAAQLSYCDIVQHDVSQLENLEGWIARTHSLLDLLVRG